MDIVLAKWKRFLKTNVCAKSFVIKLQILNLKDIAIADFIININKKKALVKLFGALT